MYDSYLEDDPINILYQRLIHALAFYNKTSDLLIDHHLIHQKQQQTSSKQKISRKCRKLTPNKSYKYQNKDKFIKKIVTVWKFINPYQIWIQICFDQQHSILNIKSLLICNGILWSAKPNYLINSIITLLQNFSNQIFDRQTCIQGCINPQVGIPSIGIKTFIWQQSLQIFFQKAAFIHKMILDIFNIIQYSTQIFSRILQISGQLELQKQIEIQSQKRIRQNNSQVLQQTMEILMSLINNQNINLFQQLDELIKVIESINIFNEGYQHFSNSIQTVINKLADTPTLQINMSQTKKQIINGLFPEADEDVNNEQDNAILKKIQILTHHRVIPWIYVSQGGFGKIQKAFVHYKISSLHDQGQNKPIQFKGWIIKKSDTKDYKLKVKHEQQILNKLSKQYYPYIQTHYISTQQPFKDWIFSKFQIHTSLNNYIRNNRVSMRLVTLAKLLEESAKGLMFLNQNGIVHFDYKPQNVIVSEKLRAKITDFGESIESKFSQTHPYLSYSFYYTRGFTSNYSAPQLFESKNEWVFKQPYPLPSAYKPTLNRKLQFNNLINEKLDIYSLGVSIYKTIFYQSDENKKKENQFIRKMEGQKFHIKKLVYSPEIAKKYGFPKILRNLTYLVLKCLDKSQINRPNLFYVSAILALTRKYLDQLENIYY